MKILLALLMMLLLNSCAMFDARDSLKKGELRFNYPKKERTKTLTLPQICKEFSTEPDPATWDEVTETYPTNHAWENCMGVGRR